jgi:Phytochelatin synthase
MVLNALKVEAPKDPTYEPYRMFTQDNFFTPDVKKVLPPELVRKQGVTLKQITEALKTFHVKVKTYYANDLTLEKFRSLAADTTSQNRGYIIVNFLRTGLGEEGGGHFSPLAAYDKKTDRFLMLDVARYRYPPVWVTTADLWKGINTRDAGANASRGFVILSQ